MFNFQLYIQQKGYLYGILVYLYGILVYGIYNGIHIYNKKGIYMFVTFSYLFYVLIINTTALFARGSLLPVLKDISTNHERPSIKSLLTSTTRSHH